MFITNIAIYSTILIIIQVYYLRFSQFWPLLLPFRTTLIKTKTDEIKFVKTKTDKIKFV